jgi:glycosyltransferase involved in cell wall biosynthesis
MPIISVLMPCYNVASTVDEAISSLVIQTLTDFELVMVDDGSTDETLIHLQDWARRDSRIEILPLPHQGIIPAMNAGLEACHAEYIARMDADDRSTSHRLAKQAEYLATNPDCGVVSSLIRGFPEHGLGSEFGAYIDWLNSLQGDKDIKQSMFLRSPLAHPSVAYRREWVMRVGSYQDHGWAEDYDLWLRLFLAGVHFGKVPEVLLEWRDHPHRLTHIDGRYSSASDLRLKAYYLSHGPLSSCTAVVIWGYNATAVALGEQLLEFGCPLSAYVTDKSIKQDQPGQKIPNLNPEEFKQKLFSNNPPVILVAEREPNIKRQIEQQLESVPLHQGIDWWVVG